MIPDWLLHVAPCHKSVYLEDAIISSSSHIINSRYGLSNIRRQQRHTIWHCQIFIFECRNKFVDKDNIVEKSWRRQSMPQQVFDPGIGPNSQVP